MNFLEPLLKSGWKLEVEYSEHYGERPFHAQIFHQKRGRGHHFFGKTPEKAIVGLNNYVAAQGKGANDGR